MNRSKPPFRADHVGSLLRPAALLDARGRHDRGEIDDQELRALEDEAITAAVRMQEEVGMRSATDGEFRRGSWLDDFALALGGVSPAVDARELEGIHSGGGGRLDLAAINTSAPFRVDDRLAVGDPIFGRDFEQLRSVAREATPKLTIPSPSMIHYRSGREAIDSDVYPDLDRFWTDLAAAYAAEIAGLADLGCTYLQLDDTSLAYVNDPKQADHIRQIGGDPETLHLQYIEVMNRALADRPDDLSVTVHMCRGNLRSSWMAEGGYDFVAEALFNRLEVDGFFMEFDDERSGGFSPLRHVPAGKIVVLGLVTTKTGELESKDDLKRRIDEAASYVDLDQLCLSPQCGFASVEEGNLLTYDDQVAKLRLVAETAEEVWG